MGLEKKSTQTIRIGCPLCDRGPHRYSLELTVASVAMYAGDTYASVPRERTFTQFFTCPVTHSLFQASVVLQETAGQRIKGLQVGGVTGGDADE